MAIKYIPQRESGVTVGQDEYGLFGYAQKENFAILVINITSSSTTVTALEGMA